jgi:DNA-binding CsgD family transcriptional regulator
MCAARTPDPLLAELRRVSRRKTPPLADCAQQLLSLLSLCDLRSIEERANGVAFRFAAGDAPDGATLTCFLHHPPGSWRLTTAEADVAAELCAGRTLAQIGRLRGVSTNTVKSQVRQIFRKLDVGSRVALARRLFF